MAFKQPPFVEGQKVMVRPDNSSKVWMESHKKGEYRDPSYMESMDKHRGKIVTIERSWGETCKIKENCYNWSWASFLPPNKEEINVMLLNGQMDVTTYRELIGSVESGT